MLTRGEGHLKLSTFLMIFIWYPLKLATSKSTVRDHAHRIWAGEQRQPIVPTSSLRPSSIAPCQQTLGNPSGATLGIRQTCSSAFTCSITASGPLSPIIPWGFFHSFALQLWYLLHVSAINRACHCVSDQECEIPSDRISWSVPRLPPIPRAKSQEPR